VRKKSAWKKKFLTLPWLAGAGAGVILFGLTAYILNREPEILPLWVLLQKTEVEPAASAPLAGATGWEQLGSFSVRAECARVLKNHVRADQEQGSHAFFDEAKGTVAITVLLSESDRAVNAKELRAGNQSFTKRVRHYECRVVQVRQPDTWLRRKLRQVGLGR
jgi:hypothetical protein